MGRYRIALNPAKCQSYGKCLSLAPSVFAWDRARKVRLADPAAADDAILLKAAKLCPYRAIAIIDQDTGEQVFPPPRTN
ncbi:MAG TPA: ferredoxin [Stellaceae bacterium]|nr:ferredoxin [Stellaceae bacterium]